MPRRGLATSVALVMVQLLTTVPKQVMARSALFVTCRRPRAPLSRTICPLLHSRRFRGDKAGRWGPASTVEGVEGASTVEGTEGEAPVRRKRPMRPGRENVGIAKGMATAKRPAYSVDLFKKGASGLPDLSRPFTVLGIETSCDDTGVAIVRSDGTILGEALASQYDIHKEWGGVVPGLARDAHAAVIESMVEQALSKAGMASASEVDAVAVTVGPGLEICLRVGCTTAKDLATQHHKPFVTIHHLEAHTLMARCADPAALPFPFLSLLVSGGHCMILESLGVGRHRILGGTLDDALGEAYDKAARLLRIGAGVAGGPAMEALARRGDPSVVPLPVPMQSKKDLNFSYAGLKNAFRVALNKRREELGLTDEQQDLDEQSKADLAASFQNVAIRHLEERLRRAMAMCENGEHNIRTLTVVGGVAANQEVRSRLVKLCEERSKDLEGEPWKLVVPPPRLCTDNGVMVAWAAIEKLKEGYSDVIEGQDVLARWPLGQPVVTQTA